MNDSDPGAGNLCLFGFFVRKHADHSFKRKADRNGALALRAYD